MRTLFFLLCGMVLPAACLGLARFLRNGNGKSLTAATIGLIALWFAIAAVNPWVGVDNAGYPFRDALPIFLVIFLVPVAVTRLARWKFL